MSDIIYCQVGCHRINNDGEKEPTQTRDGATICHKCTDRLDGWLLGIPDLYARLPAYLLPSAQMDNAPETKATKNPVAPTPIRLNVLDLLDERIGRRWLATAPANDRRGTLGTLLAVANEIRDHRNSTLKTESTVIEEADYLHTSLHTLVKLECAADAHNEIKALNRNLEDATGVTRPRPVGKCTTDRAGEPCGGPLLPSDYTGVHCGKCGRTWGANDLAFLGRNLKSDLSA